MINDDQSQFPESKNLEISDNTIFEQQKEIEGVIEENVIPVIEEQVVVEKQQVARARVRVNKRVETHQVEVETPVIHRELVVEHIPINRLLAAEDAIPSAREENGVLIIPILAEVAFADVVLRMKEQIKITKNRMSKNVSKTITLRQEVVDIERVNLQETNYSPSDSSSSGGRNNRPSLPDKESTPEDLETYANYEEEMVIPIVVEELDIKKVRRAREKVIINKRVEDREQVINEEVFREKAKIERITVNQLIENIIPQIQYQNDQIILPLIEEETVVGKQLLWVENVHVCQKEVVENQTQTVTLRREIVEIERFDLEQET